MSVACSARRACVAALLAFGACSDDAAATMPVNRDAAVTFPPFTTDSGNLYQFPCLEPFEVTHAPTFTAIYHEIFCNSGCAGAYCHGAYGQSGGLNIETLDTAYESLVQAAAGGGPVVTGPGCMDSGLRRVEPGHPERSLLYLKVAGTAGCGTVMPPGDTSWPALDAQKLEQIADWIRAGAKDDRRVEDDAGR